MGRLTRYCLPAMAAAALPLAGLLVSPAVAPPAAAMTLSRPAALADAVAPRLLRVKSFCKKVCVEAKLCPPWPNPQPQGCIVGGKLVKAICIKEKTVCIEPQFAPPRIASPSPRVPGFSRPPGGFGAAVGRSGGR